MAWTDFEFSSEAMTDPEGTVYRVRGVLTDTTAAFKMLEAVREGLGRGPILHVLDLTEVPHMTSAGVGIIAAAYTTSQREKKRLVLAAPSSRVQDILKVVGLWGMIEHAETVADVS